MSNQLHKQRIIVKLKEITNSVCSYVYVCVYFGYVWMVNGKSCLSITPTIICNNILKAYFLIYIEAQYPVSLKLIKDQKQTLSIRYYIWRTQHIYWLIVRRLLRISWTANLSNQSILKKINSDFHWKDWCWSSNTLATWCEEQTHWKRAWFWEWWTARGEGDDRGWDGWMASPTQWAWVWVNSGRYWRTGNPCVLQSGKSQTWLSDWTKAPSKL